MQSIKIETPFKGLYTNAIDRDISYSYFADTDKVKVTKQYLDSEEYQIWDYGSFQLNNETIIDVKVVNLDDDRFWYEAKKLQYKPVLTRYYVAITNKSIVVFSKESVTIQSDEIIPMIPEPLDPPNYTIQEYNRQNYKWIPNEDNTNPVLDANLKVQLVKPLTNYIKCFDYQGTLKVLTSEGIYSLQHKRINGTKTLCFDQLIIPRFDKLGVSLSTGSETNPKITFEISHMVTVYALSNNVVGEGLLNHPYYDTKKIIGSYRILIGDVFFVKVNSNLFNFNNIGGVISSNQPDDFNSITSFLFVPVDIRDSKICYVPTKYSSKEKDYIKKLDSTSFLSVQTYPAISEIGFSGLVTFNFTQKTFDFDGLSLDTFTSRFESLLPLSYNNGLRGTSGSPLKNVNLDVLNQWMFSPYNEHRLIGTFTLDTNAYGFDSTENPDYLITTFLQTETVNGVEEYIVGKETYYTSSGTKPVYKVDPISNFGVFATHSKLYVGFGVAPSSFELVKTYELCKGDKVVTENIGYNSLTGILLSNMLSIYGDIDQFEYVNGGSDYVLINNIGFLIKGGTVYYSPNDMTNSVFYKNRYIPNIYGDALISIGGMLGVIRYNKDVTLISIQVIENELYFKVYDTVSFVIKDKYSYLEIPDGVLMSLREGLYLSTPQERQLLSEPINDIFESGNVSKLLYDDYNRRIMVQSGDDTYVFDLINKVWVKHKGLKLKNIAFDGVDVITIDGSSFAKVVLSNETEGTITFHPVNLGSNKIVKRLIGLRIDLEGTLTTFKNSFGHHGAVNALNGQSDRRIEEFYIPISDQLPEVGLDFTIKFKGKIYGIEVLYDMVGEFVNTKFLEN